MPTPNTLDSSGHPGLADARQADQVRRCPAHTRAGMPCQAAPLSGSDYCFIHSPETATARAKARKAGGRARGRNLRTPPGPPAPAVVSLRRVVDIQRELEKEYVCLLAQKNSAQRARTVATLLTLALKAVSTGELEERLDALEARMNERLPSSPRLAS